MENIKDYGGFIKDSTGSGPRAFIEPPAYLPRRNVWSIVEGRAVSGVQPGADAYMVSLLSWFVTGQEAEWG